MKLANIKAGEFVYDPQSGFNVKVMKRYWCESTAAVNSIHADRISVVGHDSPIGFFLPFNPNKETLLHRKADDGFGWVHGGLIGKQGENWAILD